MFTKSRMPSRPTLASLFARSWAPPFTLRAGPPGAAPLTTPSGAAPPSRGTPDGLIPIVLRASGWRSSPVPGARPRLQPPARRGRVSRSHRLIRATPCRRSSHILERMLPVRIAPLGQPLDTMLRSGLDAASFMPPITLRGRASPPALRRAAGHRTSWNAPCAGPLSGLGHAEWRIETK